MARINRQILPTLRNFVSHVFRDLLQAGSSGNFCLSDQGVKGGFVIVFGAGVWMDKIILAG